MRTRGTTCYGEAMPTVVRKQDGRLIVLCKGRGRHMTLQVTPEGEAWLEGIFGPITTQLAIDHATRAGLSRRGYLHTRHRRQKPSTRRGETKPPPPLLAPCRRCGHRPRHPVLFCSQCGLAPSDSFPLPVKTIAPQAVPAPAAPRDDAFERRMALALLLLFVGFLGLMFWMYAPK